MAKRNVERAEASQAITEFEDGSVIRTEDYVIVAKEAYNNYVMLDGVLAKRDITLTLDEAMNGKPNSRHPERNISITELARVMEPKHTPGAIWQWQNPRKGCPQRIINFTYDYESKIVTIWQYKELGLFDF